MRKNQMTTVVNYNILNVFGNSADKPKGGNLRSNTGQSDRGQKYAPEDDMVIDVTPFSKIMSSNGTDERNLARLPKSIDRQARAYADPALSNMTYDRNGNVVSYLNPKGMNIDSYV